MADIHNHTPYALRLISRWERYGIMRNNWRQREVAIYKHPTREDMVITVGTSFDQNNIYVCEEFKQSYQTAIEYGSRGKVYVYE